MKSLFQFTSRQFSTSRVACGLESTLKSNFYNSEQLALQESVKKLVEEVINPNADQWDKDKIFPAKEVYKKFGDAGFVCVCVSPHISIALSYKITYRKAKSAVSTVLNIIRERREPQI